MSLSQSWSETVNVFSHMLLTQCIQTVLFITVLPSLVTGHMLGMETKRLPVVVNMDVVVSQTWGDLI